MRRKRKEREDGSKYLMIKFESFADNVENYLFLDILDEKMELGARRGLTKFAKLVVKVTKDGIKNPPKTGVKYRSLRVRSSRAGEYPANQTGTLRRSVGYQLAGSRRAFVGSSDKKAYWLAFGTRYMAKRAFVGRAIKENINAGWDMISESINKEVGI